LARKSVRGELLIASAACCWGASAVLGRAMFTGRLAHPVSALALTEMRNLIAAALLLPALAVLRRGRLALPWPLAWRALLLGIAGMAASNYFYYLAIARTNVAIAIVVQYTAPIWVLVYLVARRVQRPTPARIGAVVLAILGIVLVLNLARPGAALRLDVVGVGGALLAAFAFAYYNLAGERLVQTADSILVSLYMLAGAALLFLLIRPPWRIVQAHYGPREWAFFLAFGLLASLFPTLLYIAGLRFVDPTRAVVTSCLEPVSGILLAALFLGEGLAWLQVAGVVCVIAAILLAQKRERSAYSDKPGLQAGLAR
jgi:drug/metabolite transporter (DMT)-like permease